MIWLPDELTGRPDVLAVGAEGLAMHVAGLAYSRRHLLDAAIPRSALTTLAPGLVRRPTRAVAALVRAGLWRETGDGWLIVADADRQESAAAIAQRRAGTRERMQRLRARQGEDAPPPVTADVTPSHLGCDARCDATPRPDPLPEPHPDPDPPPPSQPAPGPSPGPHPQPRVRSGSGARARVRCSECGRTTDVPPGLDASRPFRCAECYARRHDPPRALKNPAHVLVPIDDDPPRSGTVPDVGRLRRILRLTEAFRVTRRTTESPNQQGHRA